MAKKNGGRKKAVRKIEKAVRKAVNKGVPKKTVEQAVDRGIEKAAGHKKAEPEDDIKGGSTDKSARKRSKSAKPAQNEDD
jgi:hypothetical protein